MNLNSDALKAAVQCWAGGSMTLDEAKAIITAYLAALLKQEPDVTLGVGDGSGKLFVHGDYDSIKACQALIFRMEKAEQRVRELELPKQEKSGDELVEAKGLLLSAPSLWPSAAARIWSRKVEAFLNREPEPPKGAEG